MGYHDIDPIAFLVSEAVRSTNTAEEAVLYEQWINKCNKKLYGKEKNPPPTKVMSFSSTSIFTGESPCNESITQNDSNNKQYT